MLCTECIRCFRAPSELTPSKALRSANGNCKIKAPDLNLQLLPPHPPKFNVELASVCQRSALRGTDRPSNPSEKSTLSFGGRGLLFCRTRSRQFLLCICLSTRDVAKQKAASQQKNTVQWIQACWLACGQTSRGAARRVGRRAGRQASRQARLLAGRPAADRQAPRWAGGLVG